jgi:hypothetical protein
MWFSSQDITLGVFASALGLAAAMFIGMMQRHRWDQPDGPTSLGGPYGNGPYRQWTCAAGEEATAALLKVGGSSLASTVPAKQSFMVR